MKRAERYWLEYDIDRSTLCIIVSKEIQEILQLDISHRTDNNGYLTFEFKLIGANAEDILDMVGSVLEIPNIFPEIPDRHTGSTQLLTLDSNDFTLRTSLLFRQWAARQDDDTTLKLREVLVSSYHHFNPNIRQSDIDGGVDVNISDNFRLETFGNCACLSYLGSDIDKLEDDEYIYLDYHNVDDARQLLSLLAGIAFLWGKAHEELYGSLTTTPPSP